MKTGSSISRENKKRKKPVTERKRRARINNALLQLKSIVLQAVNPKLILMSKLEKADLLELTSAYIRHLQTSSDSSVTGRDIARISTNTGSLSGDTGTISARADAISSNQVSVYDATGSISGGNSVISGSAGPMSDGSCSMSVADLGFASSCAGAISCSTQVVSGKPVSMPGCLNASFAIPISGKPHSKGTIPISTYSIGFNECAAEIVRFVESSNPDDTATSELNARVLEHLTSFAASREVVAKCAAERGWRDINETESGSSADISSEMKKQSVDQTCDKEDEIGDGVCVHNAKKTLSDVTNTFIVAPMFEMTQVVRVKPHSHSRHTRRRSKHRSRVERNVSADENRIEQPSNPSVSRGKLVSRQERQRAHSNGRGTQRTSNMTSSSASFSDFAETRANAMSRTKADMPCTRVPLRPLLPKPGPMSVIGNSTNSLVPTSTHSFAKTFADMCPNQSNMPICKQPIRKRLSAKFGNNVNNASSLPPEPTSHRTRDLAKTENMLIDVKPLHNRHETLTFCDDADNFENMNIACRSSDMVHVKAVDRNIASTGVDTDSVRENRRFCDLADDSRINTMVERTARALCVNKNFTNVPHDQTNKPPKDIYPSRVFQPSNISHENVNSNDVNELASSLPRQHAPANEEMFPWKRTLPSFAESSDSMWRPW